MFKPRKPTRPKKVGDTEGNDVDMDIEGNGSCLKITIFFRKKVSKLMSHNIMIAELKHFLFG